MLYHHGCPQRRELMVGDGREWLASQPLPETAREQVTVALAMIDALEVQLAPLDRGAARVCAPAGRLQGADGPLRDRGADRGHDPRRARRLPAGSPPRVTRSATPGMDITVYQSDRRRAPGHLSRQGPPALRWALYEAAQVARRAERSPTASYYLQAAERLGGNRACLSVARKLLKRSYHTLRELGEEALAPA